MANEAHKLVTSKNKSLFLISEHTTVFNTQYQTSHKNITFLFTFYLGLVHRHTQQLIFYYTRSS